MAINHGAATQGNASTFRSAAAYTGAAYNLNNDYEGLMDERFKQKAYTESGANSGGFSWAGVNAITIENEGVGRLNAYDFDAVLGSRMGTMHEISDQINTYKLKQYFAIRETYEKLYSDDKKNQRKIQRILKGIIDEILVPDIDKYRLKIWADGAGTTYTVPSAGTLGANNIVRTLLTCNTRMDNMRVPMEGRMCYMGLTDVIEMQLADELKYQAEFTNKGAVNGAVRKLGRTTVIGVPDSLMPAGAKAIFKYKKASVDVRKLDWAKFYAHVEGYSGPVVNGLYRYDSFVLANKANGILVLGDATAAPLADVTIAKGTSGDAGKLVFTIPDGATAKYTITGHNPKVADNGSSIVLTVPDGGKVTNPTADCYIRVYAEKTGNVASGIATYKFTASDGSVTLMPYDFEDYVLI